MSYPRQQSNQRYPMPMPQYPPQVPYSSYGQPAQFPHQNQSYHSVTANRLPTYPPSVNTESGTPYPLNSSQSHYPTTQVNYISVNSSPQYTTNGQPNVNNQVVTETDAWGNSAIKTLTAIFKDATHEELDAIVNNEDKLNEFVQSSEEVSV